LIILFPIKIQFYLLVL